MLIVEMRAVSHSPALEHFPAKRIPVRVEKMRQYENVELLSDCIGSESALEHIPLESTRFAPKIL
jgi:hypothetical protein